MTLRLLNKLQSAWESTPDTSFGALLEQIEEVAWNLLPQRHCSMRLMNMSDELFEQGLDRWMVERGVRATEWKS
jgi:hypothetical protein